MKTFQQFQLDSQQLDEGLGTVAKVAIKGAVKFAKKGGLKKVGKKVGKLFKKKPRRTIDPYFADKAVERGTMVRGYHGQSAKNIAQYKKLVCLLQYQGQIHLINLSDIIKQHKIG